MSEAKFYSNLRQGYQADPTEQHFVEELIRTERSARLLRTIGVSEQSARGVIASVCAGENGASVTGPAIYQLAGLSSAQLAALAVLDKCLAPYLSLEKAWVHVSEMLEHCCWEISELLLEFESYRQDAAYLACIGLNESNLREALPTNSTVVARAEALLHDWFGGSYGDLKAAWEAQLAQDELSSDPWLRQQVEQRKKEAGDEPRSSMLPIFPTFPKIPPVTQAPMQLGPTVAQRRLPPFAGAVKQMPEDQDVSTAIANFRPRGQRLA